MVLFLAGVVSGYLTGDPHTSGKELQEGKSVQDMKHYECIHDQPMRFGHSESFDEKVHQRNIHQDPVTASPSKKTDSSRPVHNWIHYYYNHPLISGGIGDFEAIFGPKKSSKYRPGNTINSMDLDNMKAKNSNPSLTSETASYPIFFTQSKKPSSDATSSETSKTEGIFHPVLISRPVLVAPPMPIMMPENQYIYYNDKGPVLLREKEPLLDQIERDEPELILPFKNQRKEQLKQQQRITTKYPDEDDNSEHYPYGFDKYSIPNEPDEDYDDEEQTDTYSEDENDAMESTQVSQFNDT